MDRNTPPSPQTFLQIVTKSVKTARTPFNKRMHGKLENYREIRIIFATGPRDLQVVLYVDNSRHSSLKKREREGKSKGKKKLLLRHAMQASKQAAHGGAFTLSFSGPLIG